MCGDLEDDESAGGLEQRLTDRFRVHVRALLARETRPRRSSDDLMAYMDKLFVDALSRSARDVDGAEGGGAYGRLAAQPLVFARLAGFLAGHMALQEDPLRKVMEALMTGYAEADEMAPDHGHDHDHGPGTHTH